MTWKMFRKDVWRLLGRCLGRMCADDLEDV